MQKKNSKKIAQTILALGLLSQPLLSTGALAVAKSGSDVKTESSSEIEDNSSVIPTLDSLIPEATTSSFAEETEQSNEVQVFEPQATDSFSEDVETKAISSGRFGTSNWMYNSDTGVLTISAGTFVKVTENSRSPWYFVGAETLKKVVFEGKVTAFEDSSDLFANLHALESFEGLENFDTSRVKDMSRMFLATSSLSLDATKLNTSNVTNMSSMFASSKVVNLDLNSFDTSKVEDMNGMFIGTLLLGTLKVDKWNLSSLKDAQLMFNRSGIRELSVPDWDMSKVETIQGMFLSTQSLRTLNIQNWDVSKVKNMTNTFAVSKNLARLDLSKWDTVSVTSNSGMFTNSTGLRVLKLGTKFKDIHGTALPNPPYDRDTNGQWQAVATGTEENPLGTRYTAEDLMAQFSGTTLADTYVWSLNKESIKVKNSQIGLGSTWEAVDNFVSATDRFGDPINFPDIITVTGTVNVNVPGIYKVTYKNGFYSADAEIEVMDKPVQEVKIIVKDSTLVVGDSWQPADNFVSATGLEGEQLALSDLTVDTATIDTSKGGIYTIGYKYADVEVFATVTIKYPLVNPKDGESIFTPLDGENLPKPTNPTANEMNLRIQYVTDFDFGQNSVTINGGNYLSSGDYGQNKDGANENTPAFVSVIDESQGSDTVSWELRGKASEFTNQEGLTLQGARLLVKDVKNNSNKTGPTASNGELDLTSGAVVASTAGGSIGQGTWSLAFGELSPDNQSSGVELSIPAGTPQSSTSTYSSLIDWEIVVSP